MTVEGPRYAMKDCVRCDGSGELDVPDIDDDGRTTNLRVTCTSCLGVGRVGYPVDEEPELIVRGNGEPFRAAVVDPDCRDGKHGTCVGEPCECACHEDHPDVDRYPADIAAGGTEYAPGDPLDADTARTLIAEALGKLGIVAAADAGGDEDGGALEVRLNRERPLRASSRQ